MLCLPPLIADVITKISEHLEPNDLLVMRAVNKANQACSIYNTSPVHQWCWNVLMRSPTIADIVVYDVDAVPAIAFLASLRIPYTRTLPVTVNGGPGIRSKTGMEDVCRLITNHYFPSLPRGLITHGYALCNTDILDLAHTLGGNDPHTGSGESIQGASTVTTVFTMHYLHTRLAHYCEECEAGIMSILAKQGGSWTFKNYFKTQSRLAYWSGDINLLDFLEAIRSYDEDLRRTAILMLRVGNEWCITREIALRFVRETRGDCIVNWLVAGILAARYPEIFILALRLIDSRYYFTAVGVTLLYALAEKVPITRAQAFALARENPEVWAAVSWHFEWDA